MSKFCIIESKFKLRFPMKVVLFVIAVASIVVDVCLARFGQFIRKLGNGVFNDHQHQVVQPLNKLATTPLYYLCNEKGQQYLQDDVQVYHCVFY